MKRMRKKASVFCLQPPILSVTDTGGTHHPGNFFIRSQKALVLRKISSRPATFAMDSIRFSQNVSLITTGGLGVLVCEEGSGFVADMALSSNSG